MEFVANLFSFEGRIGRGGYWLTGLVQLVGVLVLVAVLLAGAGEVKLRGAGTPSLSVVLFGSLLLAWIGLAASVRRCHDRDRSGFFLLVNLVPLVGPLWTFVELALLPGSDGANRFGSGSGGGAARPAETSGPNERDLDGIVARWKTSQAPSAPSAAAATYAARPPAPAPYAGRGAPATGFGRRGLR